MNPNLHLVAPRPLPSYPPPRSPLPPHKLAKIANAFGVSSPSPSPSPTPGAVASTSGGLDGRSPSAASSSRFAAAQASRWMVHIVPPRHLPPPVPSPFYQDDDDEVEDYDEDDYEDDDSYDEQEDIERRFRKGTLIPMQPTLAAQLGAIAREYTLPSTGGLELYLISSSTNGPSSHSNSPSATSTPPIPPSSSTSPSSSTAAGIGARLTESAWSILWHRVVRSEREERLTAYRGLGVGNMTPPISSRSPTPLSLAIGGIGIGNKSTPTLPLTSSPPGSTAFVEDLELNLSIGNSPLPILAKIEFELDRRKGGWYRKWRQARLQLHKQQQQRAQRRDKGRTVREFTLIPTTTSTTTTTTTRSDREKSMQAEIERLRALVSGTNNNDNNNANAHSRNPNGYSMLMADDSSASTEDSDNDSDDNETSSDISETEMLPHDSSSMNTSQVSSASAVENSILRRLKGRSRPRSNTTPELGLSAGVLGMQIFDDRAALEDIRASKATQMQFSSLSAVRPPLETNDGDGDDLFASVNASGESGIHSESEKPSSPDDVEDVVNLWNSMNKPNLPSLPPLPSSLAAPPLPPKEYSNSNNSIPPASSSSSPPLTITTIPSAGPMSPPRIRKSLGLDHRPPPLNLNLANNVISPSNTLVAASATTTTNSAVTDSQSESGAIKGVGVATPSTGGLPYLSGGEGGNGAVSPAPPSSSSGGGTLEAPMLLSSANLTARRREEEENESSVLVGQSLMSETTWGNSASGEMERDAEVSLTRPVSVRRSRAQSMADGWRNGGVFEEGTFEESVEMKIRLDEIEAKLIQFSPAKLSFDNKEGGATSSPNGKVFNNPSGAPKFLRSSSAGSGSINTNAKRSRNPRAGGGSGSVSSSRSGGSVSAPSFNFADANSSITSIASSEELILGPTRGTSIKASAAMGMQFAATGGEQQQQHLNGHGSRRSISRPGSVFSHQSGKSVELELPPPNFRNPQLLGTPSPRDDSLGFEGQIIQTTIPPSSAAWPSVPYHETSPPRMRSSSSATATPPVFALNGVPNTAPLGFRARSRGGSIAAESEETRARTSHLETSPPRKESPLGTLRVGNESPSSPAYPISPDPFRKGSFADMQSGPPLPAATSSPSSRHTSRFSADSELDEPTVGRPRSSSIVSVKNIRKLWRKSGASSQSQPLSAINTLPPPPPTPVTASPVYPPLPPTPSTAHFPSSSPPLASIPTSSLSHVEDLTSSVPPVPAINQNFTAQHMRKASRPDSGLDPFYFDQESKYPIRRPSPTPSLPSNIHRLNSGSGSGESEIALPLTPQPTSAGPLSSAAAASNASNNGKGSIKKSILKAWKNTANPSAPTNGGGELPAIHERRRRPSVLDLNTGTAPGSRHQSRASVTSMMTHQSSVRSESPEGLYDGRANTPDVVAPSEEPIRRPPLRRKQTPVPRELPVREDENEGNNSYPLPPRPPPAPIPQPAASEKPQGAPWI